MRSLKSNNFTLDNDCYCEYSGYYEKPLRYHLQMTFLLSIMKYLNLLKNENINTHFIIIEKKNSILQNKCTVLHI